MSFLTGWLPDVHLVTNYGAREPPHALSPRLRTLAEILRSAGYSTAGFYAPPNLNPALGFGRGFDRYEPSFSETALAAGEIPPPIREVVRSSRAAGRPLFLFLHHLYCHSPYVYGLPAYRRRFLSTASSLPSSPDDLDPADPHGSFWARIDLGRPEQREEVLGLYDGGVLYSDFLFGKIASLLREEGVWEPALIVVLSDHGEEFYEHGGKEHEHLFIEQLRVPLLVKFPGGRFAGRRVDPPVRLVDLPPFLCDCLGLPAPDRIQGVSFLPLVTGEGSYSPRVVSFSVRSDRVRFYDGEWTYSDDGVGEVSRWIFSRAADPAEKTNLAPARARLLPGLMETALRIKEEKRNYLDLLAPASEDRETPIDQETREKLRALGYVK
jgi:arylsulfatase A-like enzyme